MANQDGIDKDGTEGFEEYFSGFESEVRIKGSKNLSPVIGKEAHNLNPLYQEGHKAGYDVGQIQGYQSGFKAGHEVGEKSGYAKALGRLGKVGKEVPNENP